MVFHYLETIQQSLSLQWLSKAEAPEFFGKLISYKSFISLFAFGGVYLMLSVFELDYTPIYVIGGGVTVLVGVVSWIFFPRFTEDVKQHNKLILRKRYWLFYALTFLSGARRQIFVVFAGFLLVEKFNYSTESIAALFLINCALNMWVAPLIGKMISRLGERKTLIFEYIGLILIFVNYALVDNEWVAAGLYVLDHLFFSLAIAMKNIFSENCRSTRYFFNNGC